MASFPARAVELGCRALGARPMPCGTAGILITDDDSAVAHGSESTASTGPRPPYSERPVVRARQAKAGSSAMAVFGPPALMAMRSRSGRTSSATRNGTACKPVGRRIGKVPYGRRGWSCSSQKPYPNARSRTPKGMGSGACPDAAGALAPDGRRSVSAGTVVQLVRSALVHARGGYLQLEEYAVARLPGTVWPGSG